MAIEDPNDLERVDREIRLNQLAERTGALSAKLSEDCPPEVADGFLNYVEQYENAPWTTHFEQLARLGHSPLPPERLNDEQLGPRLWELIGKLAELRVFLSQTDHLSDRELFVCLYHDLLRDEVKDLPIDPNCTCHLDILGGCTEEDIQVWLTHYADPEARRDWQNDWPDDPLPEHVDPPHDRDRRLPGA